MWSLAMMGQTGFVFFSVNQVRGMPLRALASLTTHGPRS